MTNEYKKGVEFINSNKHLEFENLLSSLKNNKSEKLTVAALKRFKRKREIELDNYDAEW